MLTKLNHTEVLYKKTLSFKFWYCFSDTLLCIGARAHLWLTHKKTEITFKFFLNKSGADCVYYSNHCVLLDVLLVVPLVPLLQLVCGVWVVHLGCCVAGWRGAEAPFRLGWRARSGQLGQAGPGHWPSPAPLFNRWHRGRCVHRENVIIPAARRVQSWSI